MKHKTNSRPLTFGDVMGGYDTLRNIAFMPKQHGLSNLVGLGEAETRLNILSNVLLEGKSVLTHGSIDNREYLLYYSSNGDFDAKRVYRDRLDQLSFFTYRDFSFVSFLGREIDLVFKHLKMFKITSTKRESSGFAPKIAVVFEAQSAKSTLFAINTMYKAFPTLESVILLDKDFQQIDKKKGSMILC